MCIQVYGGEHLTPCETCRPQIHEFNYSTVILYAACADQYIMGANGPIGLNDVAIQSAMKNYFTVKKEERLELSLSARKFCNRVLDLLIKANKEKAKHG